MCCYSFGCFMIYLWFITVTHLCLQTVLLTITFVKMTFVSFNCRCHYHHIRCCGGDLVSLHLQWRARVWRGRTWWISVPMWLKSVNIWAVGAPSYPFYGGTTSIGEVYLVFNSGFRFICSIMCFYLVLVESTCLHIGLV